MANVKHSDEEINEFLALAEEIGITRAMRDLGYPKSWATGKRWADVRGIELPVDEIKAKANAYKDWYEVEDVKLVAEAGLLSVYEDLTVGKNLLPADKKQLADALNKFYDVWAKAQGKATSISETRSTDSMDESLLELLAIENAKNVNRNKEDVA